MKIVNTAILAAVVAGSASAQLGTQLFPAHPTSNGLVANLPVGIQFDVGTGQLWGTSIGADELLNFPPANTVLGFNNPGFPVNIVNSVNALGVATNGVNVFVTDTGQSDVDVYDLAGAYISSFSTTALTVIPEGITYLPLNNHLYIVDGAGNRVGEFTLTGELVATYPIAGTSPDGLTYDPINGGFWQFASGGNTVRHYDYCFNIVEQFTGVSGSEGIAVVPASATASGSAEMYMVHPPSRLINRFNLTGATTVPFNHCAISRVIGQGCGASMVHEHFAAGGVDLAGIGLTFLPNGSGGWLVTNAISPYSPPTLTATPLVLADDDTVAITLPGAGWPYHSGQFATSVGVASNGYLHLDGTSSGDFSPTERELATGGPRICGLWSNLSPQDPGGQVTHEVHPTNPNVYLITFVNVPEIFLPANLNTFQYQLDLSSGAFTLHWQAASLTANQAVVGFCEGGLQNAVPERDLSSAITTAIQTPNGGPALTLLVVPGSRALQPSTFQMQLTGFVSPLVFRMLGFVSLPGVDLGGFGAPGCRQYMTLNSVAFQVASGSPHPQSVTIPAAPSFLGLELFSQAAELRTGLNALGLATSNGLRFRIGL